MAVLAGCVPQDLKNRIVWIMEGRTYVKHRPDMMLGPRVLAPL